MVLQQLPSHLWAGVGAGALNGPPDATVLEAPLIAAIRAGWVFAFDGIFRASVVLQCVLQAVIDEVQYSTRFLPDWVPETCGGIVVLGCHPVLDEETIHGYQKPLYDRFRTWVTVPPLQANELAAVFAHCNIVSGSTMLAVSAVTGGCPGMLNTLCEAGMLRDDVDVGAMCTALYSGVSRHAELKSFYSDSIGLKYSTVLRVVFNDHGRSSLDRQIDAVSTALSADVDHTTGSPETVRSIIDHFARRHGTIVLETALFPLAADALAAGSSGSVPRDRYVVVDTALSCYVARNILRGCVPTPTPSSESFADSESRAVSSSSRKQSCSSGLAEGEFQVVLETLVRSVTRQRRDFASRLPQLPCLPLSYGPADVAWGSWAGLEGVDIDFVAFYKTARVVVFGSTKLNADDALASEGSLRRAVTKLQALLRSAVSAKPGARVSWPERVLIDDSYHTELVLFTQQYTREQRLRWNPVSADGVSAAAAEGVDSSGGAGARSPAHRAGPGLPPVHLCDLVQLFDFGDRVAKVALCTGNSRVPDRPSPNKLARCDLEGRSPLPGGSLNAQVVAVTLLTIVVVLAFLLRR